MKKIVYNKSKCIKCGICVSICPEAFSFSEEGIKVNKINLQELLKKNREVLKNLKMAEKNCPARAIKIIK
jgi:ferredoxin